MRIDLDRIKRFGIDKMVQLKIGFSKNKKLCLILDLIFGIMLIGIVFLKTGIWFETNDDHYIMDILMGQVTGGFEYHVRFCSPIFTMPMAFLYQILPSVPWYGIGMLVCHLIAFVLPLYFARMHFDNILGYLLSYVVAGSLFIGSWYVQSRIQFTSTAALLAIMGFFCYLMCQEKKGFVVFGILEFMSYVMRPNAMEMIQPIGFCVLIGYLCVCEKRVIHNILYPLFVSLCIIIVGIGISKISFLGKDWREAEQIDQARIMLMDYYGAPATEEVRDILDSYEISCAEYEGFKQYLILDYRTMKGAINEIASYSKTNYREDRTISQIIKWVYVESYRKAFHGLNLVELCMLIFVGGAIILSRQYKKILIVLMYAIGKGIAWGYIYSQGRMVNRVIIPLYLAEVVMLLAIGISIRKEITNRILINIYGLLLVPTCIVALLTGRSQLRDFSAYTDAYYCLERAEQEITAYCNNNTDKKFIVSDSLSRNWKRTVWDTAGGRDNYVYSGGWFSFAPPVQEWMDTYLNGTELYLITSQEAICDGYGVEHNFFLEYYGEEPELVESIPLSTGSCALVYRVH